MIRAILLRLLKVFEPEPKWTREDELALQVARRMHRPVKEQIARKQAAVRAELERSIRRSRGWRGTMAR